MPSTPSSSPASSLTAVVLAAGAGTRMGSALPKVLHPVGGEPMLARVTATARAAGCNEVVVIVGHGGEEVRAALASEQITWVEQRERLGTGHALAQAAGAVNGPATLLVLSGDVPLVRAATLRELVERAAAGWGAMAVAELAEPGSLGRVAATADGALARIVEAADASPEELAGRLINAGLYALPAPEIFGYLDRLRPDNAKGELYLTDALNAAAADGRRIELVELEDPDEGRGANDPAELARLNDLLAARRD